MKEWNCNEFVVNDATKVEHSVANGTMKDPNHNTQPKMEPQRDKVLYNLLAGEAPIEHDSTAAVTPVNQVHIAKNECNSQADSVKEYSQGLLRYDFDVDIDEWNCKEAIVDHSSKVEYPVQNETAKHPGDIDQRNEPQNDPHSGATSLEVAGTPNTLTSLNYHVIPEDFINAQREGLSMEAKARLKKKYPLTENFLLFQAPSLSPEVKSSMTRLSIEKDRYHEDMQNQLGTGIAGIIAALTALRERNNVTMKDVEEALESLMDAGKIFSHLHYLHGASRRTLINTSSRHSAANTAAHHHPTHHIPFVQEPSRLQKINEVHPSNEMIHNCHMNSNVPGKGPEARTNFGNTHNPKEQTSMNCSNETTSQRVKRMLCAFPEEDTEAKKKRETPDRFPGIVEILKQARALHGVHEELLLSWPCNAGAVKRYQKPIMLWWDYCQRESINVFDVTLPNLKSFFMEISKEPKTYETLNAYKTAVLLLTPEKLEKDRSFTEFLKDISIESRKTPPELPVLEV